MFKKLSILTLTAMMAVACHQRLATNDEGSAPAGINIGGADRNLVKYDYMVLSIERNDKKMADVSDKSDKQAFAKLRFVQNDVLKLSLKLMSNSRAKPVAETKKGNLKCDEETVKLTKIDNDVELNLCANDGRDTLIAVKPANVAINVCVVDKKGECIKKADNSIPPVVPTGACLKQSDEFKTANGGCQFKGTVTFSQIATDDGKTAKTFAKIEDAEAYCSSLTEFHAKWVLASFVDLERMIDAKDPISHLNVLNLLNKPAETRFYVRTMTNQPGVKIMNNISATHTILAGGPAEINQPHHAICVRK